MPDDTPRLPARTPPKPSKDVSTQSYMDDATYRDIAMALLSGERNMAAIGRRYGLSRNQVRLLMQRPEFSKIYAQERDRFYDNLSEHIRDERNDLTLRRHAAEARALTMLHEVQEHVRKELQRHDANPQHHVSAGKLDVAVKAATNLMDRAPGGRLSKEVTRANTSANVARAFAPTNAQAAVMKETLDESGVDLSDLIDITPESSDTDDGEAA